MASAGLSIPIPQMLDIRWIPRLLHTFWAADMAMDLGTANSLIYVRGRGIILNEPSVVAVNEETGEPLAVGNSAKQMYGKTSTAIKCVRPMKDGVIADFDMASLMIQWMIRQACSTWTINKPRIVIGVPSGITQVEKRAVMDAALAAGARKVLLVEEPTAAAIGAGLPVASSAGCMIVDIGGGTTDVAILSMNATVYSQSVRVAGDEMDEAIQRHIKREHGFITGIYEAERIKLVIGSALPFGKPRTVTVFGRCASSGMPGQIEVTDEFVRRALNEPISAIISAVQMALEQTSPEMAHDIVSQGIHLAGGGALLKGLAERLSNETGIKFHRTQDPLSCVVRGVGTIVENLEEYGELCVA